MGGGLVSLSAVIIKGLRAVSHLECSAMLLSRAGPVRVLGPGWVWTDTAVPFRSFLSALWKNKESACFPDALLRPEGSLEGRVLQRD